MKYNKRKTSVPDGMRDLIYDDAALLNATVKKLEEVYERNYYRPVITPGIEFLEVLDCGAISADTMYKLSDTSGRLIALRADNTTPIARIAATKLGEDTKKIPQKIYYSQDVFRCDKDYTGRRNEIRQSGVEIIGPGGLKSDICAISTALEALEAIGLPYKLEIGHVVFYNSLVDELDMTSEEKEELRRYVEAKNYVSLSFLKDSGADDGENGKKSEKRKELYDRIRKVPLLFGNEEVFGKAKAVAGSNENASAAVEYVKNLYDIMQSAGYTNEIMVDFGIVHEIDYYTGIVFRGYVEGAGEAVLSGGRYDGFISNFGKDIPATGFAINVSAVSDALMKINKKNEKDEVRNDVLIYFEPEDFPRARRFRSEMIAGGRGCEYSHADNILDSIEYARVNKIRTVAIINRDTIELKELY